jgi:hypothetical protein
MCYGLVAIGLIACCVLRWAPKWSSRWRSCIVRIEFINWTLHVKPSLNWIERSLAVNLDQASWLPEVPQEGSQGSGCGVDAQLTVRYSVPLPSASFVSNLVFLVPNQQGRGQPGGW